jgi:tetratricopeptide (TPR) repeat protein
LIDAYLGLGTYYKDQGDFKNAKTWGFQSLSLAELSHSKYWSVRNILMLMSSNYERNGELDSALYYANASYANASYSTNETNSGLLYTLGATHEKLGHDPIALDFFRRAVRYAREQNTQIDIIDSYNGISRIYLKKGEPDSAIFYAKMALQQKWARTYPLGMFHALELLAKVYESQKKADSTVNYLKLTISLKDSLFNQQKTREAYSFVF